jgi:hypothetical protein
MQSNTVLVSPYFVGLSEQVPVGENSGNNPPGTWERSHEGSRVVGVRGAVRERGSTNRIKRVESNGIERNRTNGEEREKICCDPDHSVLFLLFLSSSYTPYTHTQHTHTSHSFSWEYTPSQYTDALPLSPATATSPATVYTPVGCVAQPLLGPAVCTLTTHSPWHLLAPLLGLYPSIPPSLQSDIHPNLQRRIPSYTSAEAPHIHRPRWKLYAVFLPGTARLNCYPR